MKNQLLTTNMSSELLNMTQKILKKPFTQQVGLSIKMELYQFLNTLQTTLPKKKLI